MTFNARYDGKVIVPDEPLDLPANQKLRIQVEPINGDPPERARFRDLVGLGLPLPANHTPRFTSNDDFWKKDA